MDTSVEYGVAYEDEAPRYVQEARRQGDQRHPFLTHRVSSSRLRRGWGDMYRILSPGLRALEGGLSRFISVVFVPRPPSLVIFTSVAVAVTLFMGLAMGLVSSQVSGDLSGALMGFLLVVASLPIALLAAISLSLILPYRAFASSSTLVAFVASYTPYVLGALTGIWAALWLGKVLPFEYDPLAVAWKWTIAVAGPCAWLFIGVLSNHLAAVVERRREYEKGLEGMRESRHRIMLAHEQTRKEVAELLHGRVQGRMVVLEHWLKDCRETMKNGPADVVEKLDNASKLLREIRDQELRSITRQLYPSIVRTGLPSALNSLADRFRSVFSVDIEIDREIVELEVPMRSKLNESVRLSLYRIAEEALGNVAKHAQADAVKIGLTMSPDREMLLTIEDNGRGFDPAALTIGQGVLSIEDYVTSLGGTVEMRSALGVGTTVSVSVPVSCPLPPEVKARDGWPSNGHGPAEGADGALTTPLEVMTIRAIGRP